MKNIQILIAFILALASSVAMAGGYNCPASNHSGGGWTPMECSVKEQVATGFVFSSGYSCPAENSSAGGWTPSECVQAKKTVCAECGTVEAVNEIETEKTTGLGAVAGAVAGGVLGNQVGKGKGRTLATLIGAVGGGVAGHYGEKYIGKKNSWEVVILMDDGAQKTISFDTAPDFEPGDKVKISGDHLTKQ